MKLKSSKNIALKTVLLITAVLGVVFTALRFYQMFALTDPETGFFTDKGNFTVPLYYVLWFVTVLGLTAVAFLSNKIPNQKFFGQKNIPHAVFSALFGVSLLAAAAEKWNELTSLAYGSPLSYAVEQKQYIQLAYLVFALLGGVSLFADAVSFFVGNGFIAKLKVLRLFPVLWLFTVTVAYFSITVSYLNVTQLMLLIFADAFLMLFMFEYARFISDIAIKEAGWCVFATGTVAFVLLLASTLPTLAFVISGQTEKIVENCPMKWFNLAAVFYVATALYTVIKNKEQAPIEIEPVESAEDTVSEPSDTPDNNSPEA